MLVNFIKKNKTIALDEGLVISKNKTYRKYMVISVLISCTLGLLPTFLIKLRQVIIDTATSSLNYHKINNLVMPLLIYFAIVLAEYLFTVLLVRNKENHRINISKSIEIKKVDKISKLKLETVETSEYQTLLHQLNDIVPSIMSKNGSVCQFISNTIRLVITLMIVIKIDLRIFMGIVLLLILGIYMNYKCSENTFGFWQTYMENDKKSKYLSSILLEKQYIGEKKIFQYHDKINQSFSDEFSNARRSNCKLGFKRFGIDFSTNIVSVVFTIAVILMLIPKLITHDLTIGMYMAVFFATQELLACCKTIFNNVFDMINSNKKIVKWNDFISLANECGTNKKILNYNLISIEFDNVFFTYPGETKNILDGVSFKIDAELHYSLVGENGAGKSTIVKLLLGLYTPKSGDIRINGISVSELNREDINKYFSVVFQDFYSYAVTVRENLCMSTDSDIDEDEIYNLLDTMQLNKLINRLPDKLDTNLLFLKNDGTNLSGGEWQKLSVARSVISNRPVAILDEPNSEIDPIMEAELYKSYSTLFKNNTTIFISHRLGSAKMADKIIVLKDGKVEALGSHDDLIKNCTYYNLLFNTQRGLYYEREECK